VTYQPESNGEVETYQQESNRQVATYQLESNRQVATYQQESNGEPQNIAGKFQHINQRDQAYLTVLIYV
jgi:hypothetical protein